MIWNDPQAIWDIYSPKWNWSKSWCNCSFDTLGSRKVAANSRRNINRGRLCMTPQPQEHYMSSSMLAFPAVAAANAKPICNSPQLASPAAGIRNEMLLRPQMLFFPFAPAQTQHLPAASANLAPNPRLSAGPINKLHPTHPLCALRAFIYIPVHMTKSQFHRQRSSQLEIWAIKINTHAERSMNAE